MKKDIKIKTLKKVMSTLKKDEQVVLEHRRWSFIVTKNNVEFGVTDGETFITIIRKHKKEIFVIEDLKQLLKESMLGWKGNIIKMVKEGYGKPHPLYIGY